MSVTQILREWPPGYGGIERVAHELATVWGGDIYSLDVQGASQNNHDPLPVYYSRKLLRSIKLFGRLWLPLPSLCLWKLLRSPIPLHGHLPSPGILLVLVLARMFRPRRKVTAHWHCFLDPDNNFQGCLLAFYQWLALRILPYLSSVITTSPILASELFRRGCSRRSVSILACCLSKQQERSCLAMAVPETRVDVSLHVIYIGRLDSYKRLDLLLESLAQLSTTWKLVVVGDGPKRTYFEQLAKNLFADQSLVSFVGCLSETEKFECLADADLLVLPSDRSNEAFGIVQLEAMAACRLALAFDQPRSGMSWVSHLEGLHWSQSQEGLAEVLQWLADQPALRQQLNLQARERYLNLFARDVWLQQLQRLGDSEQTGKVSFSEE